MITGHEKFRLTDLGKKNDFTIEVNYKGDEDAETNECKILKITFSDGKECYIEKEKLNSVLFAIGTAAEQRQMIPQVIRRSRWYETVISVKAKKDIRKGEDITFPLKITLPTEEEAVIAEIKREQRNKSTILIPK